MKLVNEKNRSIYHQSKQAQQNQPLQQQPLEVPTMLLQILQIQTFILLETLINIKEMRKKLNAASALNQYLQYQFWTNPAQIVQENRVNLVQESSTPPSSSLSGEFVTQQGITSPSSTPSIETQNSNQVQGQVLGLKIIQYMIQITSPLKLQNSYQVQYEKDCESQIQVKDLQKENSEPESKNLEFNKYKCQDKLINESFQTDNDNETLRKDYNNVIRVLMFDDYKQFISKPKRVSNRKRKVISNCVLTKWNLKDNNSSCMNSLFIDKNYLTKSLKVT